MVRTQETAYAAIRDSSNDKKSFNSEVEIDELGLFHGSQEDDEEYHDDDGRSVPAVVVRFLIVADAQSLHK